MKLYSPLAFLFRASNSKLIYPQSSLVLKVRKVIFYLSTLIYKRWMKHARPSEQKLITNVDRNMSMRVDISKAMGAAFYWMGYHEFNEWRYLQQFLKSDMVFLDVGSNQGEYALFAAKRLTKGKVFAFEPVDIFYTKLCENKVLNKFQNIESFKIGLSDTAGTLPVYMDNVDVAGENEGLASLYQSGTRERFVQNIELKTLDEVAKTSGITRADFLKIDVEGAELNVLRGGRNTIARLRPQIMIEMSDVTFAAAGYTKEDIITFFAELHYRPFILTKQGTLQQAHTLPAFSNVIFVPQ